MRTISTEIENIDSKGIEMGTKNETFDTVCDARLNVRMCGFWYFEKCKFTFIGKKKMGN